MPPSLPDIFSPTASPGNLDQPDLHLRWTDRQLDLRSPAINVQTPLARIKAIQLSRAITRRRRWLRQSTTHLLQVELRLDDLRLRLTAEAPRDDTLDGLPFLDAEGTPIPFEHLRDLVNTLLAADLRVTDWDTDQTRLPPDEADRRAKARHASDAARKRALAAGEAERKRKEDKNRASKTSTNDKRSSSREGSTGTARRIGLAIAFCCGILAFVNAIAYFTLEWTGGSLQAVRAFRAHGDDRVLVVARARNDETTTLRLSIIDPTTGDTLREQHADDSWVLFREGFSVLQITEQGIWLCGEGSGVQVRDLQTLELLEDLPRRVETSPTLRAVGLADPDWISCDDQHTRFDGSDAWVKGNDGRWYRFSLGKNDMPASTDEPAKQPLDTCSSALTNSAPFAGDYLRGTGNTPQPITLGKNTLTQRTFLRADFARSADDCTLFQTRSHHALIQHLPNLTAEVPELSLLNLANGTLAWTHPLDDPPDHLNFAGALELGTLVLLFFSRDSSEDAEIFAIHTATGAPAWHREL